MSIKRIDSNTDFRNRVYTAGAVSGVIGGAYTATKKNWLTNNHPSDVFIKSVSRNLEDSLTPQQRQEASIINSFVKAVVDPSTDLETVKPQIRASQELTEAIKSHPSEDVNVAIERVFAEPDRAVLKNNLLDLQSKTKSDKLFGKNTALKLVNDNFDAGTLKLKKHANTTEKTFNMIKSTARNIQLKSVLAGAAVAGLVASTLTFVFSNDNSTKPTK